jgi:aspartate aminotransferase
VDVVHLEFGEPDFEAPPVIADAVMRAVKDGRTKYTSSLGILPLREGGGGALRGDRTGCA